MKKVLVIFGGRSPEYDVSLQSAYGVASHVDMKKYELIFMGIDRYGKSFLYEGSPDGIKNNTWSSEHCAPAFINGSWKENELIVFRKGVVEKKGFDAAFPVLHGKFGEDGTIQGLLELSGTPFVGCRTAASSLCMDKHRAHRLAFADGIRVPETILADAYTDLDGIYRFVSSVGGRAFVKPLKAGSSFGISVVKTRKDIESAVKEALKYDEFITVEEFIEGFEVGLAVMGNEKLICGEPDQIIIHDDFFDFKEKYSLINSEIKVPADVDSATRKKIIDTGKKLYRLMGCSGFARVDMFVDKNKEIVFNEINTIPGMTAHSRFPKMMEKAGYDYFHVVDKLLEGAE